MMRLVIFDELLSDMPHSFRVFLAQLLRELDAARLERRIVSPAWRIPGRRSQLRHLVVSSVLRQFVYPVTARRELRGDHLNILTNSGLIHLLWGAPRTARTVVFCHDVFALLPSSTLSHRLDFGAAVRQAYLKRVHTRAFKRASMIIVPSQVTKADLLAATGLAPERVIVIPHGIDRDVFHPGDRQEARRRLGWAPGNRVEERGGAARRVCDPRARRSAADAGPGRPPV
jgi:glycosyltransferase involved in cell wall biosynthesis